MGDKLKALFSRSFFHLSTIAVALGFSRSTILIPVMLAPEYMKDEKSTVLKSYNKTILVERFIHKNMLFVQTHLIV